MAEVQVYECEALSTCFVSQSLQLSARPARLNFWAGQKINDLFRNSKTDSPKPTIESVSVCQF